ncbi:uncharacterized protein LOC118436533 isoform X1 [Folsomia candida]|nr:uncharacterized protein LOC118436533 isoform X1 [Folsomia candida]
MGIDVFETLKSLEPVPNGAGMEDYIGSYCGPGRSSVRPSHFIPAETASHSHIFKRTVGSEDPDFCAEKKIVLCDSTYTKEIGEGFLLAYAQKYNRMHDTHRYIITETATPSAELIQKAQQYVIDEVPMFRYIKDGDRSHPPRWATLDQVTTLPYTVSPKNVILRFDPEHPDEKRYYKTFKNLGRLVEEFGDPPPSYFVTMDNSRERFRLEFEQLIRQAGNQY